ncbi:unnamed protein product [Closterium sp. Naga37s-1]|nr:unnamed protein product [Closterium sp. Naga37s-1]
MAPPEVNGSAGAAAAAGGALNKKGSEPVTPRTPFNGVQGPFGVEDIAALSAKTSALRIDDLQKDEKEKLKASAEAPGKHQPSTSGVQQNGKEAAKEAEEEDGYLSDDPDECQDPGVINDIATQAGFAIMLLIPFKWVEEVPRTIGTVQELLRLWEGHMTTVAKTTTKFHKLSPTWLSKQHFGRLQVVFAHAADANFMWSRKGEHETVTKLRLTLGWQHPENQEYVRERSARQEAIEVLLKGVPAVISPEMVRKSLVTATLLKRKRTAFLEGVAFHRVVDPVTGSDTDKIKGLVFRHPGDKYKWWHKVSDKIHGTDLLVSFPALTCSFCNGMHMSCFHDDYVTERQDIFTRWNLPLERVHEMNAASLKLTSATKAIMEDPAMVFTSTSGIREEWLCVQEGCEKAHGVSFAQAAEHAASVRHCTERLKAGSATRRSKGKLNLLAVRKEFGM